MSSIYCKGRDGYYYYQTYVYNPDTGKNDKRIFHSLGTKNKIEAERKQQELDYNYKKKKKNPQEVNSYTHLLLRWKTASIVIGTLIIMVYFLTNFESDPVKQEKMKYRAKEIIKKKKSDDVTEKYAAIDTSYRLIMLTSQVDSNPAILKPIPIMEVEKPKPSIPKHTVERIDLLSENFEQGRVYVTVDKRTGKESLKLLCTALKENFTEYSNIVICIYADNPSGKALAKGTNYKIRTNEQNEAWLAMYSYNKVEGEYFDDNPGKYLGLN